MSWPLTRFLVITLGGVLAAAAHTSGAPARQDAPKAAPATIDVVALDRGGRMVEDLGASDFSVTVDGAPRRVLWLRRVSRGPGSVADASARQVRSNSQVEFAAEAGRTVLVVIDQASIAPGRERDAVQFAGAFLDRLGLGDRVAVLRLPLVSGGPLDLTTERPETRAALARVQGEWRPAADGTQRAAPPPDPTLSPDQARMAGIDVERRVVVDPAAQAAAAPAPDDDHASRQETLDVLRGILTNLAALPGRKVVAVFSAGVPASSGRLVEDAARAAAAARAAVYSFGLKAPGSLDGTVLVTPPLERLAEATGGTFSSLARNAESTIGRVVAELGGCYVLGIEGPAGDARARSRTRVATTRKDVAVRAGSWLPVNAEALDAVLASAAPAAAATQRPAAPRTDTPRAARPQFRAELAVALGRLFEYAESYERQYSMLVAEEDYRQSAPAGGVRLRSDVLLVRPEKDGGWVSFRDVYEVDGKPVRDRQERLQRLFLDATPDAMARLNAIGQESARYNVGAVERTVNVPLLPISFLRAANRHRFDFELDGQDDVDGVAAWRLRYTERARPTLITDLQHDDVPVSGWFLVDTVTGAIVETRLTATRGEANAEISVRYRRDPALGLWVPAEMNETYKYPSVSTGVVRPGLIGRSTVEGRARYSNFRRFQVTTQEKITPPK